MANEVRINVTADDQTKGAFDSATKNASGFGKVLSDIGKVAGGFLAANVIAGGFQKLTGFMGDSVAAARDSIQVNAQLDAVLKSTGGAAGVTAQKAKELASALEKTSLFEDEAVLSGENLLLTFTGIGQDVFPQATQTMVDMSQALGQDMKSSAIQLGKALNDPIQGMTALRRVGVSFTEQQVEQVRVMQESGDLVGAQTLILNELNKEFGGSAKAASDAAGASERYKDRMNELQEQIGSKMLPVQQKLNEVKLQLVAILADKVIPKLEELYAKHWPAISKAISDAVAVIETTWPKIQPIFQFAAEFVIAKIEGMIQVIRAIVEIVSSVVNLVSDLFHGRWSQAWGEMKDIAGAMIDLMVGHLKTQFGNIPEIILGLAADAAAAGLSLGRALANGVISGINSLLNRLSGSTLIPAITAPILGEITPAVKIPDLGQIEYLARGVRGFGGGLAVVGEQGPELVHLPRGADVFSNRESRAMAGGGGISVVVNGNVIMGGSGENVGDVGFAIALEARRRGLVVA